MPQFYLIPKKLARKAPVLVTIAQWLEARLFGCIFWLMRRLSLEQASALSAFTFGLVGPYGDKAAKARVNLAIAFPDSSEEWREQTMRQIFRYLGISAAELIKLEDIWDQREQRLEFVIQPLAAELIRQKRAAVYVCAHVGAWQVTNLLSLQYGLNISIIYAPESNAVLRDMMLNLRQSFGVKLIPSDAGVRPLLKELAAGNSIGMAIDTRLDTGKLLPYFGRDALTNTTAARLALRSGAALLPIRAERLPGSRFRITVYDPVTSELPDATPDEQAIGLTVQINRYFEDWIREYPEQWICLKRRWPKAHRL
ncbi:MAG: lipid A biosynthesis acyltransferase [Gammaproteobacteria bacterium]|nr:lipid A biosynthesis acyltransferase [Gammaproteobacteria bacterium]